MQNKEEQWLNYEPSEQKRFQFRGDTFRICNATEVWGFFYSLFFLWRVILIWSVRIFYKLSSLLIHVIRFGLQACLHLSLFLRLVFFYSPIQLCFALLLYIALDFFLTAIKEEYKSLKWIWKAANLFLLDRSHLSNTFQSGLFISALI